MALYKQTKNLCIYSETKWQPLSPLNSFMLLYFHCDRASTPDQNLPW